VIFEPLFRKSLTSLNNYLIHSECAELDLSLPALLCALVGFSCFEHK